MTVKRYRNAAIAKSRVPFGNDGAAMTGNWADHQITLASRARSSENHVNGTG
jgi:hypothetical protein